MPFSVFFLGFFKSTLGFKKGEWQSRVIGRKKKKNDFMSPLL